MIAKKTEEVFDHWQLRLKSWDNDTLLPVYGKVSRLANKQNAPDSPERVPFKLTPEQRGFGCRADAELNRAFHRKRMMHSFGSTTPKCFVAKADTSGRHEATDAVSCCGNVSMAATRFNGDADCLVLSV
ncbi:MAG: hypothetical protein AAGA63_13010, partial [Pseudomonadota bacterium]